MSIFGFPSLLGDVGQENLLVGGEQVQLLLEGESVSITISNFQMGYGAGYGLKRRVFNFWGIRDRFQAYHEAVLDNGPISFWPLDETSGTVATNRGLTVVNGTYSGTYTRGNVGTFPALKLSGAGYVTVPNNIGFSPGGGQMTAELLFQTETLVTGTIFSKMAGAQNEWVIITTATGGVTVAVYTLAGSVIIQTASANGILTVGNPYHIVFTIDMSAPTINLYINGALVSTSSTGSGGVTSNGTATVEIGRRASNTNFATGSIACAAIYDTDLIPSDVTRHYRAARLWEGV